MRGASYINWSMSLKRFIDWAWKLRNQFCLKRSSLPPTNGATQPKVKAWALGRGRSLHNMHCICSAMLCLEHEFTVVCALHQKMKNAQVYPNWYSKYTYYITYLYSIYILVVLQMHDSCWPLCTCHEWQKYSQSFSVGQRKKANKQPCNKRENNMLDWLKFLRKCLTSRRQEKVEVAEMYSVGGVKVAQTRFSSNGIIKTYKVHHNAPDEWWVRFQPCLLGPWGQRL